MSKDRPLWNLGTVHFGPRPITLYWTHIFDFGPKVDVNPLSDLQINHQKLVMLVLAILRKNTKHWLIISKFSSLTVPSQLLTLIPTRSSCNTRALILLNQNLDSSLHQVDSKVPEASIASSQSPLGLQIPDLTVGIHVNETEVSVMHATLEIKKVTVAEVMVKPEMMTVQSQPLLLSPMIVKTSTCVSSKVLYYDLSVFTTVFQKWKILKIIFYFQRNIASDWPQAIAMNVLSIQLLTLVLQSRSHKMEI